MFISKIIFLLITITADGIFAGDLNLIVTKVGNCPGDENLPVDIQEFKITQVRKGEYEINGTVIVKLNATRQDAFLGQLDVYRCKDKKNDDICESFMANVTETDICKILNDEHGIHGEFLSGIQPRLVCPIRPGVYRFVNQPVSSAPARMIPYGFSTTYWMIKIRLFYEKKKVMCNYSRFHLTKSLKRIYSRGRKS